jgi:hypothetical protein
MEFPYPMAMVISFPAIRSWLPSSFNLNLHPQGWMGDHHFSSQKTLFSILGGLHPFPFVYHDSLFFMFHVLVSALIFVHG